MRSSLFVFLCLVAFSCAQNNTINPEVPQIGEDLQNLDIPIVNLDVNNLLKQLDELAKARAASNTTTNATGNNVRMPDNGPSGMPARDSSSGSITLLHSLLGSAAIGFAASLLF